MGEGEAAVVSIKRIFKPLQIFQCGEKVSVEKIVEDQRKIRERLDQVRATLNGEEGWFLTLQKEDPGGKHA